MYKEVTEFYKSKHTKDGLNHCCKVCSYQRKLKSLSIGDRLERKSAQYKEWYQANREVLLQKKREKRKDPIEKEKNKQHGINRRARMGEEKYAEWRKQLRVKYRDNIKAYNKMRMDKFFDAEVIAEIRSNAKYTKLSKEQIPKEMIDVYRMIRFINRKVKHETV